MDTIKANQRWGVPSFARNEAYNFEATRESFEIYRELSQIAEEIEKCRAENS